MFERMDPKALKMWMIVAAVVYLVLPYDLLPDFLGLPGRIDDLLFMVCLAWYYREHGRRFGANRSEGETAEAHAKAGPEPRSAFDAKAPKAPKALDAYSVLGIPPSASSDAIKAAYRERMSEYHPDKVAHLGEELQKLAHAKSQEIQHAYRALQK
jgi:DnaJ like chaperone protein